MTSIPIDAERSTLAKVRTRLVPYLALLYFAAFMDRVNVSFAAAQMNRDLGFSAYVYGLGAGIFFLGYCLFEVPSNLILHRVGARLWISRIMISWALVAGAMALIQGAAGFYALRFLLGVAEAGFFPGIVYYLTQWVPARRRAEIVGSFMTAIPISTALGASVSNFVLRMDGLWGLAGWQWLFIIETVPSLLLGFTTYLYLPDSPATAAWLTPGERDWLNGTLAAEASSRRGAQVAVARALRDPKILALSLAYFGVEIGLYGVILWIPQIFAQAGIDARQIGFAVAIPYAAAAVFMVWWSRRSDRLQERAGHIAAASLLGCTGLAASAWLSASPPLAILAISLGAAGTLAVLPIFWTLPAAILGGAAAAGAIAMINALGNVGGFAGPFVVGWIKDATGSFTWALLILALGVLSTGLIVMRIAPRSSSQIR